MFLYTLLKSACNSWNLCVWLHRAMRACLLDYNSSSKVLLSIMVVHIILFINFVRQMLLLYYFMFISSDNNSMIRSSMNSSSFQVRIIIWKYLFSVFQIRHSLRGCMKNFIVNTKSIMIADATQVQGVTTCYINMEPGVFMNKNSYGVIGKFNLTC